ncbi:MAG: hypothetical protein WC121_06435 [Candidatus Kapaibacterium sp.]
MKLIISIFILIFTHTAFSTSITVNDETAEKGQIIHVPVYADITEDFVYQDDSNIFRIEFYFNALMLDFKDVVLKGESIIVDSEIKSGTILNTSDYRNSTFYVEFSQKIDNENGILFYLEFEVLAGPDTIASITPNLFILNNVEINSEFVTGNISIPEPVTETDKSYISNFYPNPFHREAKAEMRFTKPTRIKISTYDLNGSDKLNEFCYSDCLQKHFRLTDEAGIEYMGDELLMDGKYTLELRNDFSTLAAGAYLLVIETDYKVLSQRFVVIK